ncbi:MAG: hypothetical protein EXQ58_10755 [Acidobacteria bacterium]|nr:hypothetical protein [Acidobacteriota bacterium]
MKNNLHRILSFITGPVLGIGALLLGSSSLLAQFTDTTPPTLTGLTITPSSIDVTSSAQTVQIDLNVTDDLSGVDLSNTPFYFTALVLTSPTGAQQRSLVGSDFQLVSGTRLNGTWRASLTVPRFVESGTWRVSFLILKDAVGNSIFLSNSQLIALGLNPNLAITSTSDLVAPTLTSLSFTPSTIDTSTSGQGFTIQVGAQDAVSGINPATNNFQNIGIYANFSPPPGIPQFSYGLWITTPVSGNAQAGVWQTAIGLPQYSQAGSWSISYLQLRDLAGNVRTYTGAELQTAGFPNLLTVNSNPSDTIGPTLTTFDFGPTFIDTSAGPMDLTTRVTATDDLSGISGAYVNFRSPSGNQRQISFNFLLLSGGPLNGTLTGTVAFPQFSEAGTWKVEQLFYFDRVFNYKFLNTSELEALSLPTNLNVILPTLQPDGTISSPLTGGIVVDSVFGSRAQITFPPGVLSTSTVVAIDVLNSPLSVQNPTGFSTAPASYFVNISLTPHPDSFLEPGVTLVLPLVNLMTPGSNISLFRIDPGTGNLVPTPSVVSGQNVVGTVNPDGLSATFTGIAQLSVVVAYVPSIQIDITPGKTPNSINPRKQGSIAVAILTTAQFNASTVEISSVRFGRTGTEAAPTKSALADVDGDGDLHLVLHFDVPQTRFLCGDVSATLTGRAKAGQAFRGVDFIKTPGCK